MFGRKRFIDGIVKRAIHVNKHSKKILVFPEVDDTILKACSILIKRKMAHPIVLGGYNHVKARLDALRIRNFADDNIFDYLQIKKHIQPFLEENVLSI